MANRPPALDDKVFSISDLKHEGSKKLPKSFRGKKYSVFFEHMLTISDFYNEGAMDLITWVAVEDDPD